jgi:hypothetical protein
MRIAGSEWCCHLYDDGQQGIEDTFGGEEAMPDGLLERLFFGDRIFLDRESRPFAFHCAHHGDNRFGNLNHAILTTGARGCTATSEA